MPPATSESVAVALSGITPTKSSTTDPTQSTTAGRLPIAPWLPGGVMTIARTLLAGIAVGLLATFGMLVGISVLPVGSAAWRLLTANNAALTLSFLDKVFVEQGARSVVGAKLAERLEDELFALNQRLGRGTFPQSAKAYPDDWSAPGNGWLRTYYPPDRTA